MTQEEKQLLLVELCARLPYGIICLLSANGTSITEELKIGGLDYFMLGRWEVKPYLRPMSSMTDKELVTFLEIRGLNLKSEELQSFREGQTAIVSTLPSYSRHIDWLNKHHFDYRGLIEKGLAIEAPEEMYK